MVKFLYDLKDKILDRFPFLKSKPAIFYIDYSDKRPCDLSAPGHFMYIGSIHGRHGTYLGTFFYLPMDFGAVLCNVNEGRKYFIAKDPDMACADAYIHPQLGGLYNVHSLREFLNVEFGL